MRTLLAVSLAAALCAVNAFGVMSWSYGWEDGVGTALGTYGNAILSNSTEQAYEGTHSLKITEDPLSGTPQTYIWWATGLNEGDGIVASFHVYDTVPGTYPRGRIWGHYTDTTTNVNDYSGSAGGNETYADGGGWTNLQWSWSFNADGGNNKGFVVEARIYSAAAPDNVIYIDTASITVSNDNVIIHRADGQTIPEPMIGIALLSGVALLGLLRRK